MLCFLHEEKLNTIKNKNNITVKNNSVFLIFIFLIITTPFDQYINNNRLFFLNEKATEFLTWVTKF